MRSQRERVWKAGASSASGAPLMELRVVSLSLLEPRRCRGARMGFGRLVPSRMPGRPIESAA